MNLAKLKKICLDDKIPIVRQQTIDYLVKLVIDRNYQTLLEIGTAYGYSANYLSNKVSHLKIDTIENNPKNYQIAIENQNENINYLFGSVFDYDFKNQYDLIFIDGPKSNQELIFEKLQNNLNFKGIIVIDNIFLKDVDHNNPKKLKLIEKINKFRNYLLNLKNWNVQILNFDDGIAICERKIDESSC